MDEEWNISLPLSPNPPSHTSPPNLIPLQSHLSSSVTFIVCNSVDHQTGWQRLLYMPPRRSWHPRFLNLSQKSHECTHLQTCTHYMCIHAVAGLFIHLVKCSWVCCIPDLTYDDFRAILYSLDIPHTDSNAHYSYSWLYNIQSVPSTILWIFSFPFPTL